MRLAESQPIFNARQNTPIKKGTNTGETTRITEAPKKAEPPNYQREACFGTWARYSEVAPTIKEEAERSLAAKGG